MEGVRREEEEEGGAVPGPRTASMRRMMKRKQSTAISDDDDDDDDIDDDAATTRPVSHADGVSGHCLALLSTWEESRRRLSSLHSASLRAAAVAAPLGLLLSTVAALQTEGYLDAARSLLEGPLFDSAILAHDANQAGRPRRSSPHASPPTSSSSTPLRPLLRIWRRQLRQRIAATVCLYRIIYI
eukprot:GHVU01091839.1.p2 GENE.GHVU01091839.1~~GHVU01091839.1.p2  ORF type:complete len:185 (+),score=31.96 GHVU01091839.1:470-1024(+)